MLPIVSVIITTKNSAKTISPLLSSIKAQSYKGLEIIVVDNKSTDQTCGISKKFTDNVFQKGPERSAQRNYGAQKSRGKYLFFLDSDMILTPEVVDECVQVFENKRSQKIGSVIVPEQSFGEGFWAKVKAFERDINQGEPYFEAARFFPKKIFAEFKGYDENLTGPEDWDLPKRITKKYQTGRTASYILHNEGKASLLGVARKKYYYGLKAYTYLSKHNIPVWSATTLYFLRPAFYRQWKKLLIHPFLTLGMILMLSVETVYGGWGYLVGKWRNEK